MCETNTILISMRCSSAPPRHTAASQGSLNIFSEKPWVSTRKLSTIGLTV